MTEGKPVFIIGGHYGITGEITLICLSPGRCPQPAHRLLSEFQNT
jgi:hypothetical protein